MFHPSHQLLKNGVREIDIPPRKLLNHHTTTAAPIPPETTDMYLESPKADETHLQKFLPYNGSDDDADPYSSDHFRMFEFKVRRCTRSRSHDWTDCPFAHPGEKARRRDPKRYHYSGTVCSEFRRGSCSLGDNCEFAHGVFECWLHPARYRTEVCKDGKNCKRKVCFFAHSSRQLRVLPPHCHDNSSPVKSPVVASTAERNYHISNHCCLYCHSVNASPTSTLVGMSHFSAPMSPPLSPVKSGFSLISRCADCLTSVDSCGFSPISRRADRFTDFSISKSVMVRTLLSMAMVSSSSFFLLQPQVLLGVEIFSKKIAQGRASADDKLSDNGLPCPDLGWVNDLLT
ncbi:hypothetical protein F0562_010762 [Nyssa sinensis]|uniref:C3H1-type domain-containing protein n=1 Tax=Nyssa sinensis TaxID=561372 RepID=A0A5J5A213_9ASTE|nr:hypothetical protein F0562_010762 [Nyssa sinensis]